MSSAAGNALRWARRGGGGGGAAHRAHCRGGFGNDVMGRGVSRQAPRALGRAAGAPLLPAAVGGWVRGEPQVGSGEMLGWLRPRGRQALGRAGVSGSERGGGVLAGCPAELARGWLAANKAALMETCCCTKAEHSGSFLSVWGGFFFFPLFPPRAAFLYAAWLGGHLHHGPAAASGDLLGSEQPSPK